MITQEELPDLESLRETHKAGYEGLRRIYIKDKFFKSLRIPIFTTLIVNIVFVIYNTDPYVLIISLINAVFAIVPNLLGFILGGYAIIIGLGNENFLKATATITKKKPISYYQKFSSIFALNLLSQSVTLIFSLVLFIISQVTFNLPIQLANILNHIGLFIFSLSLFYTIFQIPTMIINIFSLSQAHHLFLYKEKIEHQPDQESKNI